MRSILVVVMGFANGVVVGSGIVALLTLLDIIPRLAQLTKTYRNIVLYENIIVIGATFAAFTSLTDVSIHFNTYFIIVVGFFMGTFVGMLASALAEVMNVIPVLVRRFRLEGFVIYILYSLAFGKVLGSLLHWFIPH
ncbi:stage V sporulation protein AB [Alkaliphilus hydrothermalis]|uniref:Stage V sporulation protein AB n=1 Tax=Alkaliphilus hydrothermalis TaxID=1482730 RepID=A0ABS2NKT8_9FIRM|nr:stage V sporulation protein AB [Alkaliphilus hydrothermalis]MBM7613533.1 stage V sporulation protein AB [Alkaliphilus hydrothermalis]